MWIDNYGIWAECMMKPLLKALLHDGPISKSKIMVLCNPELCVAKRYALPDRDVLKGPSTPAKIAAVNFRTCGSQIGKFRFERLFEIPLQLLPTRLGNDQSPQHKNRCSGSLRFVPEFPDSSQ